MSGNDRRARHPALPWLTPAFAAHLLGQTAPQGRPEPRAVALAYSQPESRMPLRPRMAETA